MAEERRMKNLILAALFAAAALYAYRGWSGDHPRIASEQSAQVEPGGPARQWQQAPGALLDMQEAVGGSGGGAARAARDAVSAQVGR
jgi:hypothetical protein